MNNTPQEPTTTTTATANINNNYQNVARYSRQMLLFGPSGQSHLSSSSVLVVGAGGIGSSLILYLTGSGIGNITIVDNDVIERNNLHRQIIHDDAGVGNSKAQSGEY